jgi:hypothetical protein
MFLFDRFETTAADICLRKPEIMIRLASMEEPSHGLAAT